MRDNGLINYQLYHYLNSIKLRRDYFCIENLPCIQYKYHNVLIFMVNTHCFCTVNYGGGWARLDYALQFSISEIYGVGPFLYFLYPWNIYRDKNMKTNTQNVS